jgi:hypothetical protein
LSSQDKQVKGLVLGSFLGPKTDMIFGDGVGPALFEPYCQLNIVFCSVDAKCLGLKTGPPRRQPIHLLRASFGPPCKGNVSQVEVDLTSSSCGWNLELGRSIFARLLSLTF